MSEPFIGEIRMFGGNFAPRGWALCNGQLLAIAQNTALFSVFGTTYGGDGRTTFGLPDLRGRFPRHAGNGPGISGVSLGERAGSETTSLGVVNLPPHRHMVAPPVSNDRQTTNRPVGAVPSRGGNYSGSPGASEFGSTYPTENAGGGQAFSNVPPYVAVNFIVALEGLFPSRE